MESIERNEIFDLAFRFITETGENIFLTGKAGTGKTTFLKYLKDNCTKNIVVAAPTGVAAINAGGVTLHSLFQLPFHPFLPSGNSKKELLSKIRYGKQRQQLLRKMELLVIDEISMVRCDVMDAIDTILKSIRHNHQLPFGGVQLLFIGDLYQLSPVAQNHEWNILKEYYDSPFFFDSMAIKEQMPLLVELNKIYRQKEESFVSLLNKVRNNDMCEDDYNDLHLRYIPGFTAPETENFITLTSHNNQAELINQRQLHKLNTYAFDYTAVIEGEFSENLYPAEEKLTLKEGAQVMFLKNDLVQKRYFNGKIAVVKTLYRDRVTVECDGGLIDVQMETWENSRYTLNRSDGKLEQETLGTFTQYPLRLAWAITIHKSQGLTFDKVMIDAGAAFSSGQVYVALSRCTSLDGIVLLSRIPSSAISSNSNVIKGQQLLTHKGSLADRFAGARQAFTQQLLEEIFSFNDVGSSLDQLEFHIKQQSEKLNGGAVDWANSLKGIYIAERSVGLKFIGSTSVLMKSEAVIEDNAILQQRIVDAANYFLPKFLAYRNSIQDHPLITEHKETATVVNEHLLQLFLSVHSTVYYLEYCRQPFSLTSFLQHKLRFALPRVNLTCYASGKKEIAADISNTELYETLKRWRDLECAESGQPIYMVANQASLKEIALYLPLNKKHLMLISGFGKAKAEKYGDEILEAVQSYCERHDMDTNIFAKQNETQKEKTPKKEGKPDTKTVSFGLFKEGKDIPAIAKERNLSTTTIEGHIAHFIAAGEIDINGLVSKEKQLKIMDAVRKFSSLSHKTLIDNLPKDISYGDVKMMVAYINAPENNANLAYDLMGS
jgi:PIF1-like helicase/Helix-turn-helix domain/HRDC domain/Helicase